MIPAWPGWAHFVLWDWTLVVAVSLQAALVAYLYQPKWKALLITLPLPFTISSLALGQPLNATHVLGLVLLLLFTNGVRLLHARWGVPIVIAIITCAVGYCVLGVALAPQVPQGEASFWAAAVLVAGLALAVLLLMPQQAEAGHRETLPLWIKLPAIALVVIGLVLLKKNLQGFMSLFPMVGVFAAYEGRRCLWTLSRQIPILILLLLPLMAISHLLTPVLGIGWALLAGWVVYVPLFYVVTLKQWQQAAPLRPRTLEE